MSFMRSFLEALKYTFGLNHRYQHLMSSHPALLLLWIVATSVVDQAWVAGHVLLYMASQMHSSSLEQNAGQHPPRKDGMPQVERRA